MVKYAVWARVCPLLFVAVLVGQGMSAGPAEAASWTGTLSISADRAEVHVNDPSTLVRVTASPAVTSGLSVSIYDDNGVRLQVCYVSSTPISGCTVWVAPGTNQTRSYHAFVAVTAPESSPPPEPLGSTGWVTVTDLGYIGTVTLTSDPSSTDANNRSALLKATVSKAIARPYVLSVYDDLGNQVAACAQTTTYPSQTTCSVWVAPETNTSRTYTAYVAQDTPVPGPPTLDVKATDALTIANLGYTGTVTLTSDRPSTDANNPSVLLRATVSKAIARPYVLSIYDDLGNQVAACAQTTTYPSQTTCSGWVAPATNSTRIYTAYVAQDAPATGQPSVDVKATHTLTISNLGYTGTVTLTTDRSTTDASNPSALLKATMSKPIARPYVLSIYDDRGVHVASCAQTGIYPSSTTCTAWVQPGAEHIRIFRAYVAQHAPSPGPPTLDVKATSHPVTVTDLADDQLLLTPRIAELEQLLLARYGPEAACLVLGEKVRTHAARSSVPDATLICNAKGVGAALRFLARTASGAEAVISLYEAGEGTTPDSTNPDCDHISDAGTCLDEGSPDPEEPPEPDPAGGAIPPSYPNCLDAGSQRDLLESMPEQNHHVATHYGAWGEEFQEIADRYGLSVQNGGDWNIVRLPHRGPHPVEYHRWVMQNIEKIDSIAQGDVATFKSLFAEWVTRVVLEDPTIFRVAYWKCRRS